MNPMRDPKILVWMFVVWLCPGVNAYAEELGWYVGGGGGISLAAIDEDFWVDDSISATTLERWGPSYQFFGGYRFNRHFALELEYMRLADTVFTGVSDGEDSIWVAGSVKGTTEIVGMAVQGVGYWPLGNPDQVLYVKGGLFLWDSLAQYDTATINVLQRFNDDGGTLIGGMGAEMKAWGNWRVRGEIELTTVRLANREVIPAVNTTIALLHPLK